MEIILIISKPQEGNILPERVLLAEIWFIRKERYDH